VDPHTISDQETVPAVSPNGDHPLVMDEPYAHSSGNMWLSHDLTTSPTPLRVGAKAVLDLVIAYPYRPIACEWIKVTVATGTKAGDLTSEPTAIKPSVISTDKRWGHSTAASGIYMFRPTTGKWLPLGEQGLQIQFSDIVVNGAVGTTEILVQESVARTEDAKKGEFVQHQAVYSLGKFPADFQMSHFTAKQALVFSGEAATLSWTASTGPTYQLTSGMSDEMDVTKARAFTSAPLYSTTVFRLTAQHSQDGVSAVHHLDTTVQVIGGDVAAGRLAVNGPVSMMDAPQRVELEQKPGWQRFVAQTDGFLIGPFKPSKTQPEHEPTLLISSVDQSSGRTWGGRYAMPKNPPPYREHELPVPVPANSLVTIGFKAPAAADERPGTDDGNVFGEIDWLPMGRGGLLPLRAAPLAMAIPDPSDSEVTWFFDINSPRGRLWPYHRGDQAIDRNRMSTPHDGDSAGTGVWRDLTLYTRAQPVFRDPTRANTVWRAGRDAFIAYDVKQGVVMERMAPAQWSVDNLPVVHAKGTLDHPDLKDHTWVIGKEDVHLYDMRSRKIKKSSKFGEVFPGVPSWIRSALQSVIPLSCLDPAYGRHAVLFMTADTCVRYSLRHSRTLSPVRSIYTEFPALARLGNA
jgi:hypothetical protein